MKFVLILLIMLCGIPSAGFAQDDSAANAALDRSNWVLSSMQSGLNQIKIRKVKQSYLPGWLASGKERKYVANTMTSNLKWLRESLGVSEAASKVKFDWAKNSLKSNMSVAISAGAKNGVKMFQAGSEAATTGATALGYFSAGDTVAAASEVANGTAKSFAVSGSMAAGAFVGSFIPIPVVGTCIGGAVGAAAAGWGSSKLYDYYVKPFFDKISEGSFAAKEDPLVTAWLSKHQPEIRKIKSEYGQSAGRSLAIESGYQDSEVQLSGNDALTRAMAEAEVEALKQQAAGATAVPADATRPVIPIDCTIEAEVWHPDHPQYKWKETYHLLDGKVTGQGYSDNIPSGENCSPRFLLHKSVFSGTISDNVISVDVKTQAPQIVCRGAGSCVTTVHAHMLHSHDDITLHMDRSLTLSYIMQPWTVTWSSSGCDISGPKSGSNTNSTSEQTTGTLQGRWRIK